MHTFLWSPHRLQQQHYYSYFADGGWQPGEVRAGVAQASDPRAHAWPPVWPWRKDSVGFGDSCLVEAGSGEKVGLGQLGWEMLVAMRAWSLSPTHLCREARHHQGGANFWKNITETKQ